MKSQKGFTLVEAAVAIGIVAILSGIVIPLVIKNLNDAKRARARNDINVIVAAIVAQIRDTGGRPVAAGGPNAANGAGNVNWISGEPAPNVGGAAGPFANPNNFANLFTVQPSAAANVLFGFPNVAPVRSAEFGYKGPYLSPEVSNRLDPWGSAYVILGYNANGQAGNGPIWVVSAGEDKDILAANVTANPPPAVWDPSGVSASNIAVRAN